MTHSQIFDIMTVTMLTRCYMNFKRMRIELINTRRVCAPRGG